MTPQEDDPPGAFSNRVRISRPGGPALVEWAVREDREVLDSEEEGQPIYRTQRFYVVPLLTVDPTRWNLEDAEEGQIYRIVGVNERPGGRYADIVVERVGA